MMDDQMELATMSVELDVSVALHGGSVVLSVGDAVRGFRLTTLVQELIESRESEGGVISKADAYALREVVGELRVAADMLANRVELELDRARAREVA